MAVLQLRYVCKTGLSVGHGFVNIYTDYTKLVKNFGHSAGSFLLISKYYSNLGKKKRSPNQVVKRSRKGQKWGRGGHPTNLTNEKQGQEI